MIKKILQQLFGWGSEPASVPAPVVVPVVVHEAPAQTGPEPAPEQLPDFPADRRPPLQGWSKDIADCHMAIQVAFPKVKAQFEAAHKDCTLKVDYTYRGPMVQLALFKKGRAMQSGQWVVVDPKAVVTNDDGVLKKGHHNTWPSQAADVYVVKNGKILWGQTAEEEVYYMELGKLWEQVGIISGMTWKYHWKDPDHVQVAYLFV